MSWYFIGEAMTTPYAAPANPTRARVLEQAEHLPVDRYGRIELPTRKEDLRTLLDTLQVDWSSRDSVAELTLLARTATGWTAAKKQPDPLKAIEAMSKPELMEQMRQLDLEIPDKSTRPLLMNLIKSAMIDQEEASGDTLLTIGAKHRGKPYEMILAQDSQYCHWAVQTAGKPGAHPELRKFARWLEKPTPAKVPKRPGRGLGSRSSKRPS